ncbi:MAG: NAD(P)-dependent oxidoreductase [Bacteroidales bacterium]|nr:NAD(P)-dependent oxidoreductase [Candidatus Sodaliphilus aphodohippi]
MAKRILITGAGGFIGGFLVAEALSRGYETWAAVRSSTSREFLTDERINFIELDFTDSDRLETTIKQHVGEHGKWDYVVHNLGATKCANYLDFERINHGYMRLLVETLQDLDAVPEVFLMMSSLSVMGQGDDKNYIPFAATDVPNPNTRYGMSKLKAEVYLQMLPDFPYTIFRCTGVYGPHERDYYLMMKSIKRGFDFSVGFRRQMLTFIYVRDLAVAVMDALERGPLRKAYFISEPKGYTQKEFRNIVCKELGKRFVLPVTCPLWIVKAVCTVCSWWSITTLKPMTLNKDKYKILKQRNWLCDVGDAQRDFGFAPRYDLEAGVREAIEWYRNAGWL